MPSTWYEELLRKVRPVPPVKPLLLCVEDDSTYLTLRKAFLEQSGYNVIGAATAEDDAIRNSTPEALRAFQNTEDYFLE